MKSLLYVFLFLLVLVGTILILGYLMNNSAVYGPGGFLPVWTLVKLVC